MKSNILQPLLVQEELIRRQIFIFTPEEFGRVFGISATRTKYFLENYTKKGLFLRIKKGLYVLKHHLPNEEQIANALYRPSYLSFEYALAKHGLIPEMVYSVTSATTKPTREFVLNNKVFIYFKIKKQAFTGYTLIKEGKHSFFLAEPEKALVDYLYFVSLGQKSFNERINISALSKTKIIKYAKLYQREGLLKIIQKI
jgi:predicted transcriptional regulator of viral defense system